MMMAPYVPGPSISFIKKKKCSYIKKQFMKISAFLKKKYKICAEATKVQQRITRSENSFYVLLIGLVFSSFY
jgi:hypothetical protein